MKKINNGRLTLVMSLTRSVLLILFLISIVYPSKANPLNAMQFPVSVNVKAEKNILVVEWEVRDPDMVQRYIVETANDPTSFTLLTEVEVTDPTATIYYVADTINNVEGHFYCRIAIIELDGNISYSEIVSVMIEQETALINVSPNPCIDHLMIKYKVEADPGAKVITSISVYNTAGNIINHLIGEELNNGVYTLVWDGRDQEGYVVKPGVYILKMQIGDITEVRRIYVFD